MCYSLEASRNSLLINIITCSLLFFTTPHKIPALYFLYVGLMQLLDYILWLNQDISDDRKARTNFITTKVAMIVNLTQPVILGALLHNNGTLGDGSIKLLFAYIVVASIYMISTYPKLQYTLATPTSLGTSLDWKWNDQKYNYIVGQLYFITTIVLFGYNFEHPLNKILLLTGLFSFLTSLTLYRRGHIGRMWCKISAFIPLVLLGIK